MNRKHSKHASNVQRYMKLAMFLTVHLKDAVIIFVFKNFKNFRSCLNCPSPYIMSLFCDLFLPREDDINYEFNLHEPYATAAMRQQNATTKIFNSLVQVKFYKKVKKKIDEISHLI